MSEKELDWPTARFNSIATHPACPVCSTDEWWVFDMNETSSALLIAEEPSSPTYARACTKCGFVQQFLKVVLDGTLSPPEKKL